tara:strand:+ start:900 stop:1094 length:195 start_codon:yes stop_codon:yes gene_type:complete
MNYEITGISEPQLDKNGRNHVRIYTPSSWTLDINDNPTVEDKTIFCYDEEMFDKLQIGKTITVK